MSTSTQTDHSALLEQTKKLEELGFSCSKKILKLLIRTNGNFEVVKNFLEAKKRLKESSGKRKLGQTAPVQITISSNATAGFYPSILPPVSENTQTFVSPKEEPQSRDEEKYAEKLRRKTAKCLRKQMKKDLKHPNPSVLLPPVSQDSQSIPPPVSQDAQSISLKEERSAEKLRRKNAKNLRKEAKTFHFREKKDHKHQNKDLKRSEKKSRKSEEKKLRKEKKPIDPQELFKNWPAAIDHLYLDGNNMMYVTAPIRSLCLSRSTGKAERALSFIAKAFSSAIGVKCTLIFDDTKHPSSSEDFTVRSARPSFKTSDDALVYDLQNKKEPISQGCSLYVTSDRELGERLTQAGGVIYKPKEWFYLAAEILSGKVKSREELDAWIAELIQPLL